MTETDLKLLRVSYSNNISLLEIEKKLKYNIEKEEELSYILKFRDPKISWNMTTANLVLLSGILTFIADGALKLQKGSPFLMFGGLSIASIAYGIRERKTEEKYQRVVGKAILQKYEMDEINPYTYTQYNDTVKEIENLKKIRTKIIEQEKLIRSELENVKELTK